jgi:hypothetical protein
MIKWSESLPLVTKLRITEAALHYSFRRLPAVAELHGESNNRGRKHLQRSFLLLQPLSHAFQPPHRFLPCVQLLDALGTFCFKSYTCAVQHRCLSPLSFCSFISCCTVCCSCCFRRCSCILLSVRFGQECCCLTANFCSLSASTASHTHQQCSLQRFKPSSRINPALLMLVPVE